MSVARRLDLELSDGRIALRPPTLEDASECYEAILSSLEDLLPWLGWVHPRITQPEVEDWIIRSLDDRASGQAYEHLIAHADTGRVLGACGLGRIDPVFLKANLGYWVRTGETGHGVASRATRLLARFGFERVGLQRIEIIADVRNFASQRAAEKAGATREGIARNGVRVRDRQSDAVMYSLVPADLT